MIALIVIITLLLLYTYTKKVIISIKDSRIHSPSIDKTYVDYSLEYTLFNISSVPIHNLRLLNYDITKKDSDASPTIIFHIKPNSSLNISESTKCAFSYSFDRIGNIEDGGRRSSIETSFCYTFKDIYGKKYILLYKQITDYTIVLKDLGRLSPHLVGKTKRHLENDTTFDCYWHDDVRIYRNPISVAFLTIKYSRKSNYYPL